MTAPPPLDPDPLHVDEPESVPRDRPSPGPTSLGLAVDLVVLVLVVIALSWFLANRAAPRPAPEPTTGASPATSEVLRAPVTRAGGGSSAASLVPGAPLVRRGSGGAPSATMSGWASWYDNGPGLYGAAGPVLRHALGANWRGSHVIVTSGSRSVVVVLSDWCACARRHGHPTLIDLSSTSFRRLAPLSSGIITVTIETGVPVLPPTDTEAAP